MYTRVSPFLRIQRRSGDDAKPVLVYESEYVKTTTSPRWKPISMKVQKLCNGDYFMPLAIQLWDWKRNGYHTFLGETHITLNELRNYQLWNKSLEFHDGKKSTGVLVINEIQVVERPSFMDYIMSGIQLNLITAVDFTASNGYPLDPNSLHYRDPQGRLNHYQTAIVKVGEILVNYDYDQLIPLYGFGCKPK
jgi:hypothetical protein